MSGSIRAYSNAKNPQKEAVAVLTSLSGLSYWEQMVYSIFGLPTDAYAVSLTELSGGDVYFDWAVGRTDAGAVEVGEHGVEIYGSGGHVRLNSSFAEDCKSLIVDDDGVYAEDATFSGKTKFYDDVTVRGDIEMTGAIKLGLIDQPNEAYNTNTLIESRFYPGGFNGGCIYVGFEYDSYGRKNLAVIEMRYDNNTTFKISYNGILTVSDLDQNNVFASGRMVNIGDSDTFNGSAQILPAIAPLVTDELPGTSTYFVPNCHLKNVKSLSSTAEITYNDKTYTLNMDKAIELGLFVESTAAATTSEESTETA